MSGRLTYSHWHSTYTSNGTHMICDPNGKIHNIDTSQIPVCMHVCVFVHVCLLDGVRINGLVHYTAVHTNLVGMVYSVQQLE